MSKYIDADLYVEMQIYDNEHEEWGWWKGTIEDLLDQWTEEGCPQTIEVNEDCISRGKLISELAGIWDGYTPNIPRTMLDFQNMLEDIDYKIRNAPSVIPTMPKGELEDCCSYEVCKDCREKIGFPHWRFCPQCGKELRSVNDVI